MKVLDVLGKTIRVVSPKMAASRAFYKAQYEGASMAMRMSAWRESRGKSANQEIRPAAKHLRNRSRDLVRNNWIGTRAVQAIETGTIGAGIKPRVDGGKPPKDGPYKGKDLNELLQEYVKSTDCDADGKLNLYGLQSLAMRTIVESGEVLVMRSVLDTKNDGIMPFHVRILEPDYLPFNDGVTAGDAVDGIIYDTDGRPKTYRILKEHPGDDLVSSDTVDIPAEDMAHIYRMDRPGQGRGVTWFSPIMIKARGLDGYDDAQLMRQKIAACFSAFINVMNPKNNLFGGVGQTKGAGGEVGEEMQPGLMTRLGPGESITFASPPGVDGYGEYTTILTRQIAAGIGITYEALTGDYSKVNFSSGRMGHIQMNKNIVSWRDHIILSQLLTPWTHWFFEAATILGYDTTDAEMSWVAPHFEMIDPQKEIAAAKDLVRSGFSDMPTQIQKFGRDPDDVLAKIKAWNKLIDKDEIKLDSDPRHTAGAGQAVISSDTETNQDNWSA